MRDECHANFDECAHVDPHWSDTHSNLSSEYFSRQILFLFGRYRGRNGGHGTAAARGRGAGRGAAAAEDAAPQPWPGGGLKKKSNFSIVRTFRPFS